MNRARSESRFTHASTILFHDQSHCLALCSFVIGFFVFIIGNFGHPVQPYYPCTLLFLALAAILWRHYPQPVRPLITPKEAVIVQKEAAIVPSGTFSLDFRGPIGYTIFYSRDVWPEGLHLLSSQEAFRVKWSLFSERS
jgi:hypothetical protein